MSDGQVVLIGVFVAVAVLVVVGKLAKGADRRAALRTLTREIEAMKGKGTFDRFMGSGVCDVCNATISPGQAFQVPVNTFYGSPGYRTYLSRHPMVALTGNVDAYIARARAMDSTTHSAVCTSCVHMFEK